MWDILRLPSWNIHVYLCRKDKYEMIGRMNNNRFICRLMCASCISCLRAYGSDLGLDLVFEIGLSVGVFLRAPVGYLFGY